jgi:methanogenic corrinoid protein MtbC1
MAEHARHSEALDEQRGVSVRAALHDVVGDLADQERAKLARNGAGENSANDAHIRVICLPANDEADEIVGTMLLHLLELRGYEAMALTQNALASEMVEKVEDEQARIVCISALPPAAITHARYLCKRLYARFPDLNAVIGLWTFKGDLKYARSRIGCSASAVLTTTLAETMRCIAEMAQTRAGRPPLPARH